MLSSNCLALFGLLLGAKTAYGKAIPIRAVDSTTPVLASSTGDDTSTITSAPYYYYPAPTAIAPNNCSYYNATEQRTLWNQPWCSVYAGNVDTSPSVYIIVSTLYGKNACGTLGPTASRAIFGFDLDEVSTIVPYFDTTATYRRSTRQLYLSDLVTDCEASYDISTLTTMRHPIKEDDTRCNPSIVMPMAIKSYGNPYWMHCGVNNFKYGLFDPPYAIPTVDGLLVTTAAASTTEEPAAAATSADPAAVVSTDPAVVASTDPAIAASTHATAVQDVVSTKALAAAATATEVSDPSGGSDGNSSGSDDSSPGSDDNSSGSGDNSSDSDSNFSGSDGNSSGNSDNSSSDDNSSGNSDNNSGDSNTGSRNSIGSGAPQTSAADLANAPSDPAVSTVSEQVISLGADGVVVVNDGSSTTITTMSVSSDSAGSVVVYSGTTLTLGGSAATMTNVIVALPGADSAGSTGSSYADSGAIVSTVAEQVVSLGTDGVVVVEYGSSTTKTHTIPASGVTVSGSIASVSSVVVYHGTTLTLGGPAVTVTDAVVTLPGANASGSADSGYSTPESTPVQVGTSPASRVTSGALCLILSVLTSACILYQ
ncbi:hypothetical protein BGZ61DRAFT_551219 [Ilyonectria robusta]|uniref:uncharacterized protein n=1 Tax=Ilyonectria robusta TaxID=1079257 RepID=UPI001E8D0B37|nr:uncharacterized protein BGZ61DRAFT_551219 [Ilyonectria robusta]KAH8680373.1 hypothetical protein BGZ61DRAFT_551219 [Ilyonectria robusta]